MKKIKKVYSLTMVEAFIKAATKEEYKVGENKNKDLFADWLIELAENANNVEVK